LLLVLSRTLGGTWMVLIRQSFFCSSNFLFNLRSLTKCCCQLAPAVLFSWCRAYMYCVNDWMIKQEKLSSDRLPITDLPKKNIGIQIVSDLHLPFSATVQCVERDTHSIGVRRLDEQYRTVEARSSFECCHTTWQNRHVGHCRSRWVSRTWRSFVRDVVARFYIFFALYLLHNHKLPVLYHTIVLRNCLPPYLECRGEQLPPKPLRIIDWGWSIQRARRNYRLFISYTIHLSLTV
jgi:hypothetical protein